MQPAAFATQVTQWLEVLGRPGEDPEKIEEARAAAIEALRSASSARLRGHFTKLAKGNGAAAMGLAAEQGLAAAIRLLAATGADVNVSLNKRREISPVTP